MIADLRQPPCDEEMQRRLHARRRFLQRGAAAVAASVLLAPQSVPAGLNPAPSHGVQTSGHIDAHVHVWTDDERYPIISHMTRASIQPATALPDDLLKVATPAGVDRIVLIQPGCYGFDNSYMLETIRKAPLVFRGVAVVDWHGPNPDLEMRKLKKRGVRGFRIYPDRLGGGPTFEGTGFEKMFRCAAREQMTLSLLIDPDALPILPQYCQSFPDTPIAIDHLARIGAEGLFFDNEIQALIALAKYPRVKIKVSAFYALGAKRPPHDDLAPFIRRVYDAFGPQRMMWGTDWPYQIQHESYEDSIALVRDRLSFLSAEDRDWILRKTAQASFFDN
jgi:predicted TIM-barrel fold metal-dependent hydrolase